MLGGKGGEGLRAEFCLVTVNLYWSNSEQNPAPNLSVDLDGEFQKLSKLRRSIIPI